MLTLAALPWSVAQRDPRATVAFLDRLAMTAAQLDRSASGIARRLERRGIAPGDRVGLLCGNGLAFAPAYYGALRCGAVVAPLSTASTTAELAAAIRALRVRSLITDTEHAAHGRAVLRAAAGGATQLVVDESTATRRDHLGLPALCEHPSVDPVPVAAGAPAVILGTSGTTGMPKRVVHSHGALLLNAHAVAGEMLGLQPGDVQLAALPLAHSFGMSAVLNASLLAGAGVAILRRFDPEAALEAITAAGVTVVQGVPTMLARLAAAAAATERPATLRRVVVSGSPLPPGLAAHIHASLCTDVVERWGLTECSPLTMRSLPAGGGVDGDVGHPLWGVVVRTAGGAASGELEAASASMFLRYDGDRRGTDAVRTGGFLRTGDLGSVAEDGRVTLTGRVKDVVIRGGNNIAALEVERVIAMHPEVVEVAVVGIADPDLGEELAAAVVLRHGGDAVLSQLREQCAGRLAAHKVPRVWREVASLPRTSTGKVLKAEVRAALA